MADQSESRYETRTETNRWESFTRLTFVYFADQGYDVTQEFEDGHYKLRFTDEERGETAVFVYEGGPPDMAQESLQQMQRLFEETADLSGLWMDMLKSGTSR
jgi:hypothetical protein